MSCLYTNATALQRMLKRKQREEVGGARRSNSGVKVKEGEVDPRVELSKEKEKVRAYPTISNELSRVTIWLISNPARRRPWRLRAPGWPQNSSGYARRCPRTSTPPPASAARPPCTAPSVPRQRGAARASPSRILW